MYIRLLNKAGRTEEKWRRVARFNPMTQFSDLYVFDLYMKHTLDIIYLSLLRRHLPRFLMFRTNISSVTIRDQV